MVAEKFLKLLVCPETRTPLHVGNSVLVNQLNGAIARRSLQNKSARVLETAVEGALVREDRTVAYPIVDQIPMLLMEEGIALDQLGQP